MGSGMDRAVGLASIAVGLLATVVLAVAISTDYWLYTDEPIDTGLKPELPPIADATQGDVDETDSTDVVPVSSVGIFTTNSGLWRMCIYAKVDYTGEN